MDQAEHDLLAQLGADVDGAFECLVGTYWPQLYAFILRRTTNAHDAEDIVSEAFVRAYIALKGYPLERIRTLKIRPWLYKITYHEYCRYIGKSMQLPTSFASIEESSLFEKEQEQKESQQPEEFLESAELRWELEDLVAGLPERYREVVNLYYFEELSYQEIADLLDQPLGTIKSSIHRGLRLLRKVVSIQSNEVH